MKYRKKLQVYDERLKKLEGVVEEKCLGQSVQEFQEFGERLWKLEQITDDRSLTSRVASEVSKSLFAELNAVCTESCEASPSNDNEQYNHMNNLRVHRIQPDKDCQSLPVNLIKSVLHVSDIDRGCAFCILYYTSAYIPCVVS